MKFHTPQIEFCKPQCWGCELHAARLKFHSDRRFPSPRKFYLCSLQDRSSPPHTLCFGYARAAKRHTDENQWNLSRLSRRSELHINRSNLSVRCRRFVRTRLGVNDGIFGRARSAAHRPHGYRCVWLRRIDPRCAIRMLKFYLQCVIAAYLAATHRVRALCLCSALVKLAA